MQICAKANEQSQGGSSHSEDDMSSSTEKKLPGIQSLLGPALQEPQGQYNRHNYDPTPAPRSQHPFPEAQSLAPAPLVSARGRQSYTSSHGQYSSEFALSSSEYPERRSGQVSSSSSVMASVGESQSLPPIHDYHGLPPGASLEPSRDPRLPSMYGNGEPAYPHHTGTISPPRSGHYGSSYDSRPSQQDYMAYNTGAPQFGSPGGSQNFPMNIEQIGGEFGEGKQKRRRGNLPKPITDILRAWFQDHVAHPYPTEEEKQHLMTKTGLSLSQISNWFINARRRSLPALHKQAQTESEVRDSQMHLGNKST